jgi:hypothetical protein
LGSGGAGNGSGNGKEAKDSGGALAQQRQQQPPQQQQQQRAPMDGYEDDGVDLGAAGVVGDEDDFGACVRSLSPVGLFLLILFLGVCGT